MKDLFSFLNEVSRDSDFKATLSERGGFITFSNSGRRGSTKFFQIGLDNILQTLKDILTNLETFKGLTEYDEASWRNNGTEYFSDPVANANSTVQTKPLFSTLSKVIIWANQPTLDSTDSDAKICLDKDALETTIAELEEVADSFRPSVGKPRHHCDDISRQQIFYGAPGTGKSHSIKCETKEWEEEGRVVRTTFHPDSDYSTFVGAYKPTTESVQRYDIYNKPMTREGLPVMEQVITYSFVPQAFLQAYLEAWKNRAQPEYLIIEEINRGNCAQVFGDLFQLLDRGDDGYSEYAIRADKDLQRYISRELAEADIEDYPNVKSGVELLLPDNLYIRATMNTSDQSLFPIDSAFKRRWDWHYVPISKGRCNGVELNWLIDVDGDKYDWWSFIKEINTHVFETTNSEDKQLGFFFCKAKNNVISAKSLVSKVIFYLWNDVFKDFGFENPIFTDKNDAANPKLSFDKFYLPNGKIRIENVSKFLTNLGLSPVEFRNDLIEDESDDLVDGMNTDDNATSSSKRDYSRFSINGDGRFKKSEIAAEVMKRYINDNPNLTADEIASNWGKLDNIVARLVQTEAQYNDYAQSSKEAEAVQRRFIKLELSQGSIIYVSNQFNPSRVERLSIAIEQLGWPYKIKRITE